MDSGRAVSVIEPDRTYNKMVENMKIGLDVHGVIDVAPEIFAVISQKLVRAGHKLHIITGKELSKELFEKLNALHIQYHYVFSITSYHKSLGTHITYKNGDPTQPLIAPHKWDRTKADYCKKEGLHIHIDDTPEYGHYFQEDGNKCQFILFTPETLEFLKVLLLDANI